MSDALFSFATPPPATVAVMEFVEGKGKMHAEVSASMLSDHLTPEEGKHPTITFVSWAQKFPEVAGNSQESGSLICMDYSDGYEERFSGHNDEFWSRFIAMLTSLPRSRREQIVKMLIGFENRKEV
jgi:hypothetical protein